MDKGGGVKTKIFQIDAGGLTSSKQYKGVPGDKKKQPFTVIDSSEERQGLVGDVSNMFGLYGDLLGDLRSRVAPGVSDLRKARLGALEDVRRRSIGNLRENLSRRKVMGSSFAGDALNRAEREFGREQDRIEAESFLTELDVTQKLAAQEYQAKAASFQTHLDELNLQTQIALGISQQATSEINANKRLNAQLDTAASLAVFESITDIAGTALGYKFGAGGAA